MNEIELGLRTLKWLRMRGEAASYERKRATDLRKEVSGLAQRFNKQFSFLGMKDGAEKIFRRDFDQPVPASSISLALGDHPVAAVVIRFVKESHPQVRVAAITPFGTELLTVVWDLGCKQIDSFSCQEALNGVFESKPARLTVLRDMMTQLCQS